VGAGWARAAGQLGRARPAGARRPRRGSVPHPAPATDMFRAMFWPLLGGFIAFVLLAVLLGWIMDPSRRDGAGHDGH
jgi:hypothetical protein